MAGADPGKRFPPTGAWFALISIGAIAGARIFETTGLALRPCPFLAWTGHPCPTCFATRALADLGRFDPAGAFAAQPLVTVAALLLFAWGVAEILLPGKIPTVGNLPGGRRRAIAWSLLLLIAGNWIYLLARG